MQTWENECNSPTSSNVFLSVPSFFYHSIFMLFDAFCVYFLLTLLSLSTFHHHSRRHYFTTIKFIEYFGVQYEMSKNSPFVSESFTSILSRSVPSTQTSEAARVLVSYNRLTFKSRTLGPFTFCLAILTHAGSTRWFS